MDTTVFQTSPLHHHQTSYQSNYQQAPYLSGFYALRASQSMSDSPSSSASSLSPTPSSSSSSSDGTNAPPPSSTILTPDQLLAIKDPWARIPAPSTLKYIQTRLQCLPPNKVLKIRLSPRAYQPACRGSWVVPVTIRAVMQRGDRIEVRIAWWAIANPLQLDLPIEQRMHLDYFEVHDR